MDGRAGLSGEEGAAKSGRWAVAVVFLWHARCTGQVDARRQTDGQLDGWIDRWLDGWMDGWMDVRDRRKGRTAGSEGENDERSKSWLQSGRSGQSWSGSNKTGWDTVSQ